ncbi:uncharacterized protein FOMMEDRAFT_166181 [Fomitiporia mediterranea MF3/22]|uniref:uncharacterized protein n=1 Tax=Fomitiporia mediterranea (strain MF3/22) TaxID=694068 RepID=UPI000440817F|nr:uncharacterized protein FOMMEDRAFT_166181 [Fomitiporia mediterranea MF3/22]EJD05865.1 hypothetical protein FOMMEDRAFT_166181 [Fomitiporia mediterranea MF3/22]
MSGKPRDHPRKIDPPFLPKLIFVVGTRQQSPDRHTAPPDQLILLIGPRTTFKDDNLPADKPPGSAEDAGSRRKSERRNTHMLKVYYQYICEKPCTLQSPFAGPLCLPFVNPEIKHTGTPQENELSIPRDP